MATPVEPSLRGIRGWLILVAIGLCVQPLILVKTLSDSSTAFKPDTWGVLTTPGSPAFHPLWAPLLIGEVVVNVALLVWSAVLLYQFFRARPALPRLMIAYLAASLAVVVGDFAVASMIPTARAQLGAKDVSGLVRAAISTAVWIPYFLRSRRVAATFVN